MQRDIRKYSEIHACVMGKAVVYENMKAVSIVFHKENLIVQLTNEVKNSMQQWLPERPFETAGESA